MLLHVLPSDALGLLPALVLVGCAVLGSAYVLATRWVNLAHPRSPVPRWRVIAFLLGIGAMVLALAPPLDEWADRLLTAHMMQHILLAMVVPVLLALGSPVTVVLRAAPRGVRNQLILPLLHSRAVQFMTSPYVGWVLFSLVMWEAHFSPLYNAALENEALHALEHLAFLVAGCLFWWPVVGADPMPRRLGYGGRMAFVLLQMPISAAVGLVLYFAPAVLYAHYAAVEGPLGIDPLIDQQVAGLVMWGIGDLLMLGAVTYVVASWMRADVRRSQRRAPAPTDHGIG